MESLPHPQSGDATPQNLTRERMTSDGEVTCQYNVPVFYGKINETGQIVTVHKDHWRAPNEPSAWLIKIADSYGDEPQEREIIAIIVNENTREFWAQLDPGDGSMNRSDYLTGQLDERYQLLKVKFGYGRYTPCVVEPIESAALSDSSDLASSVAPEDLMAA